MGLFEDVSVEVHDQYQLDFPHEGFVMLDNQSMRELDLRDRDVILLQGKRYTRARAVHVSSEDQIENYAIRINSLIRNNLGVKIGQHIRVTKEEDTQAALEITLKRLDEDNCPMESIKKINHKDLVQSLDQAPIMHGDGVEIRHRDMKLFFKIVEILPSYRPTHVDTKTKISIVDFVELR
jgi:hypothetical protein